MRGRPKTRLAPCSLCIATDSFVYTYYVVDSDLGVGVLAMRIADELLRIMQMGPLVHGALVGPPTVTLGPIMNNMAFRLVGSEETCLSAAQLFDEFQQLVLSGRAGVYSLASHYIQPPLFKELFDCIRSSGLDMQTPVAIDLDDNRLNAATVEDFKVSIAKIMHANGSMGPLMVPDEASTVLLAVGVAASDANTRLRPSARSPGL
eukprot:366455-Chlamydomonas_euryale.AAC.1